MKKIVSIILLSFCFSLVLHAQLERKIIRKANKAYQNKEYAKAEVDYKKAMEMQPDEYRLRKNLGAASFRLDNFESASQAYTEYTVATRNSKETSDAFYNLGNSLLQAGDFPKSIEAFKQSLRKDPKNNDARYNLEIAQYMLSKQQKNEGGGGGEAGNQKQDKKEDKDKNQQENKDQKQEDQQEEQSQPQPQKLSEEDAERILQALENDEKELQEDIKKQKARVQKIEIEKNW